MLCLLLVCPALSAQDIGALGRIIPQHDVLYLGGTPNTSVKEIRVRAGDQVAAGDVLMLFTNEALLRARWEAAQAEIKAESKRLAIEIELRKLALAAARRALERAAGLLASYEALGANAIVERELTLRRDRVADARHAIKSEELQLRMLRTREKSAPKRIKKMRLEADAALESAMLRAPVAGTVLKVSRQVGERVGNRPALLMADLTRMYVKCDVYEGDVLGVREGMTASVDSNVLPEPLSGVVEHVSTLVDTRSKLAKVWVRLNDPEIARRLIGMEVSVTIKSGKRAPSEAASAE